MKNIRSFVLVFIILFVGAIIFTFSSCGNDEGVGAAPDAYYWDTMGSPGEGWVTRYAIVNDPSDNKPVVVFRDMTVGRPHVMKWDSGTTWTDLGFLTTGIGDQQSITIDPTDNKPVVIFTENTSGGKARVKKWDSGTTWTDLGFPSTGFGANPSITIDPSDNKPLVVFRDGFYGYKVQVKKWDSGTTWIDLGFPSTGVGYTPSIAIDHSDNKPVVVFIDVDNGKKAHAMKWDSGTTWTDLGFPSTIAASNTVMAIDPSDNKPLVAFVVDEGNYSRVGGVHVKKWHSGTIWTDLGFPSPMRSEYPSIVIDPTDNKPIVTIRDWQGPTADVSLCITHVMKWSSGTAWTGLGFPIEEQGMGASITIDPSDNKPVVACYNDTDGRLYVAKHP
jgi:hypothetical protein